MLTEQLAKLRQQRTAPLILELDLTDGVSETRPSDPVSGLMARHRLVLTDVLDGLRRARGDDRVKALIVRVGGRPIGLGMVQELRRAVRELSEAGKLTAAWAESFGEFSAGNVPYYLATAFDTIYLQPSGDLGLTGLAVQRIFLRGTLDRLGVDFQVARRHEYKSAAEQLTERGFSAAGQGGHRAAHRVGHRAAGRGDRAAPPDRPPGKVRRADRPRPVPRRPGAARPGWWTRSATGTRCTPASASRPAPDAIAAVPGPLPALPRARRAGPQAAGPAAASGASR